MWVPVSSNDRLTSELGVKFHPISNKLSHWSMRCDFFLINCILACMNTCFIIACKISLPLFNIQLLCLTPACCGKPFHMSLGCAKCLCFEPTRWDQIYLSLFLRAREAAENSNQLWWANCPSLDVFIAGDVEFVLASNWNSVLTSICDARYCPEKQVSS